MRVLRFQRFTNLNRLQAADPALLRFFFERFSSEFKDGGQQLPSPSLPAADYCLAVASLLLRPERLPEAMVETLFMLDALATPEGHVRVLRAATSAGVDLQPDSTPLEDAIRLWLQVPAVVALEYQFLGLLRLSRFEYWGSGAGQVCQKPFADRAVDPEALAQLASSLDPWFAQHQRGHETTRIALHHLEDEYWFLIRHGDLYARAPRVDRRRSEILHFRPERQDVVVYSPAENELRINARTKGERELYRHEFGRFLAGNCDYFSEQDTYTLEPLRDRGPEALFPPATSAINKVKLCQLEVAPDLGTGEFTVRGGDDLLGGAAEPDHVVPRRGRLARARFEVHLAGSLAPRPIEIQPPNVLKLARHYDASLLRPWLRSAGFRRSARYEA